ncbi:MAG TPA: hypothetical protein DCL48_06120, partial [Alphaproteobacteria bacterium]|nr:hypothetical protein [Alphaproteobacteria bacterium]
PLCSAEMQAHADAAAKIHDAGGRLFAVTSHISADGVIARRTMALPYETLIDADFGVALAFGLMFQLPQEFQAIYADDGMNLPVYFDNNAWFLSVPATFVVGSDGVIAYAFRDIDFRERADPDVLVRTVKRLTAKRS